MENHVMATVVGADGAQAPAGEAVLVEAKSARFALTKPK